MTDTLPAGAPAPGTYTLDPERTTIRADVKAMFGLIDGARHLPAPVRAGQHRRRSRRLERPGQHRRGQLRLGQHEQGRRRRLGQPAGAKAYPEISFAGQGARRDGDGWVVPGSVTAHGTTVPAEVRLSDARQEAGEARFRATARLDRTSFGVTKKKGMVGRTVDLVIEAVARPA